jgi:hypothetical protein
MNDNSRIIARANELGFFPTPAQAKKISEVSAERYGQMRTEGRAPMRGAIPADLYAECEQFAIRQVMGEISAVIITGTADEIANLVQTEIAKRDRNPIRVQIDEL